MNLQENIYRIKEVMGIMSEKLGDIKSTPLYHKTSTLRGLDIINSDSLRGASLSPEYLELDRRLSGTKKQKAISFTRDRNWEPNMSIGIGLGSRLEDADITFVVDKERLKTKYKVEPFNFIALDPTYVHTSKNDELEERVLTDEIYPLHRFLIDIIYTGDNEEVKEIIDTYLSTGEAPKKEEKNLTESKDWGSSNQKLEKTFKFKTFEDAIDFVNKVANVAEQQNHHPDIQINYNKVKLSITDHEKGRVSDKCHKFVKAVNNLNENDNSQELHEKCWPGYTQKGMKTMFGKRYPNCVKKTKK